MGLGFRAGEGFGVRAVLYEDEGYLAGADRAQAMNPI